MKREGGLLLGFALTSAGGLGFAVWSFVVLGRSGLSVLEGVVWLHFKHVGVFRWQDFSDLLPDGDRAMSYLSAVQADLDGYFALRVGYLCLGGGQPHQAAAALCRKVG